MKSHIKSILIPTDFSESSENALAVGIAIAKRQKSDIVLLHVIDRLANLQPTEVFLPEIQLMPDINFMIEQRLKEISDSITRKTGINVKSIVLNGQPSDTICWLAHDEKTELIVIGTHGTAGLRELFIGSEAYRVVKNAPCPVLTVPGKWENKEFKKVLFPIRLIPGALEKYFYARPIIEKNNSELFLLGLTEMKNERSTKELMALIKILKQRINNDNIKSHTSYCPVEEFPAEVSKITTELGIDLIILTANIDPGWKSFFIGPFVQQVINQAQVPALSIKPSDGESEQVPLHKLAEEWGKSLTLTAV